MSTSPTRIAAAQPALVPLESIKGRGTATAMPHRFEQREREQFDDGWGALDQDAAQEHLPPETQVIEEHAKSIVTRNQSPDINFDYSINPYRGCEHGCIYCFARPTHSYLNLSPGLDFETRIVAKANAAERLRETLASARYEPRSLVLGTATDAYQPVERKLGITRRIVEVLAECAHPFSVVTKSAGIERELDLIAPMAAQGLVSVYLSVTTLDNELARILEPRAAAPARRLRTIKALAEAGVPVGVSVSPIIPFINEPELERILEAAAAAGASSAFSIPVRLPWEVNPLFQDWLQRHFPDRAERVMARIRDMRGGKDNDARFGTRFTGEGVWAELLQARFQRAVNKLGLRNKRRPVELGLFRRPPKATTQGSLF
ncbi:MULTISPECIES: PA0069 family radical SAM protein [unclassified Roseateles]|uniref:PA0069 family radical SAM protein n=1 Tax=unclassified Roseateles TaxID=2626991 RepID=UPI0006FD1168|nr:MULTISPECIES: PA0069 family radical SAM protein [unclassified Roseateles]KQW44702.1 radical SAM protein [Pelomonas sp. Root405]KRA70061.1 radical SAM protein [Pelomonas sp. Root662]